MFNHCIFIQYINLVIYTITGKVNYKDFLLDSYYFLSLPRISASSCMHAVMHAIWRPYGAKLSCHHPAGGIFAVFQKTVVAQSSTDNEWYEYWQYVIVEY